MVCKIEEKNVPMERLFNNSLTGNIEILFCGHQYCLPDHFYGPFVRAHYLMIYVHSGKGIFKTQHTVYHLETGATFFLFPGEITYYKADHDDPWEYSWIAFNGEIGGKSVQQMLLRASISSQKPLHITRNSTKLNDLYREIFTYGTRETAFVDLKVTSLFLDIMYQYIATTNYWDSVPLISAPLSDHISLSLEFIKSYYDKGISVSDVANYLGISREYFCNLFKKQFGVSPVRFIKNYRLKISAILLLTTDYSISKISDLTGFTDYNYYSNQFSKLYQISPSQYRKQGWSNNITPYPSDEFPRRGGSLPLIQLP